MKKSFFNSFLFCISMITLFGSINNVSAAEPTPETCFEVGQLPGMITRFDTFCDENGENCVEKKVIDATQKVVIHDYKCYEGNSEGLPVIKDVVIPENLYIDKPTDEPNTIVNFSYSIIINENAFSNKGIDTISLPNTVEKIGNSAFFNNNLKKVVIPSSVTEIEKYAFAFNQINLVVNYSNISNETLTKNNLIFGTSCTRSTDTETEEYCEITSGFRILNLIEDGDKPGNDELTNPKTLDVNNKMFIIISVVSLLFIIKLLFKTKKQKSIN